MGRNGSRQAQVTPDRQNHTEVNMSCKRLFFLFVLTAWIVLCTCQAQEPAKPATPDVAHNHAIPPDSAYSVLDLLRQGGPVMYPLYACSVLIVAFWIERILSLRTKKVLPASMLQNISAVSASDEPGNRQKLLDEIMANASPMARILQAGIRKTGRPPLEIEKAVEDAGAKEAAWMQRNNKVFAVVATIAPLLGLLGTVTGLMRSFMTVATSSDALGKMEMMAGGIYEALVTTVAGLTIAIPAMSLYFYYQDRVERLVRDIDGAAEELLEKMPDFNSGANNEN